MYFVNENDIDDDESIFRFVKLTENAHAPQKSRSCASGFVIYSAYEYEIQPFEKELTLTDLQISVPYGCSARLASRWDLAYYHSIQVLG